MGVKNYAIGVEGFTDHNLLELMLNYLASSTRLPSFKEVPVITCNGNSQVQTFMRFGTLDEKEKFTLAGILQQEKMRKNQNLPPLSAKEKGDLLKQVDHPIPLIGVIDGDTPETRKKLIYLSEKFEPFTGIPEWNGSDFGISLQKHINPDFDKWLFILEPDLEYYLTQDTLELNRLLPSITTTPLIYFKNRKGKPDSDEKLRPIIIELIKRKSPALISFINALQFVLMM